MFDGPDFPKSLDEEVFEKWIAAGKERKIGYQYLLIVWDEFNLQYKPVYAKDRSEFDQYEKYKTSVTHESLVAAYDLFSESRIV